MIKFTDKFAADFLDADDIAGLKAQTEAVHNMVSEKSGLGNDFLGWVDLPVDYDKEEFARIKAAAKKIQSD